MVRRIVTIVAFAQLAFLALPVGASASTIVFDSFTAPGFESVRAAATSPGSLLQFSSNVTINYISVLNNLDSDGDLKFLIFDHATHNLLYSSAATPFVDDGVSWKTSSFFTFTFLAGTAYDVGAIANVSGRWSADLFSDTQNGITSVVTNPNFSNFASPFQSGHALADGSVRLLQETTAVPEPASLLLLGTGLAAAGAVRRRRSAARH